jgi:hypothetical protein
MNRMTLGIVQHGIVESQPNILRRQGNREDKLRGTERESNKPLRSQEWFGIDWFLIYFELFQDPLEKTQSRDRRDVQDNWIMRCLRISRHFRRLIFLSSPSTSFDRDWTSR